MWTPGVLVRYWMMQLPDALLVVAVMLLAQMWLAFPTWIIWSAVGLWIAKDAMLYPFVWRAYDPAYPATLHSLEGERGVAIERLAPSGYVRIRGELWRAELHCDARPVEKGEMVCVKERRSLTVIVISVDDV
ncbi:MAG: NfeD family protein [Burkholderiales bacterium]|nr:NfeD family protein [Burkholderiales bacterium]